MLLAAFLLMNASVALAEYPAAFSYNLPYQVLANTTVSITSGMQVAQITFEGSAGEFGAVFLSPVQTYAQNMRFLAERQSIMISKISFYPAFGLHSGKVTIDCSITDASGGNTQFFNGVIAEWND